MSDETRILDLLLRWEEFREQGQSVTPEELCGDSPELLDEVKRRVRHLQDMSALLDTPDGTVVRSRSHAGSPTDEPFLPCHKKSSELPTESDGLDPRHYGLLDRLGSGGMGEVYRCTDPSLGRDLAIKVLRADQAENPELERRFLLEARIAGSLQHPGIVPVHNLGRLRDGRPYFTMKVVRGRTLADILREPGADAPERRAAHLDVFAKVCQAVAYAHSRGVIHRDLKPANVMVGAFGEVQVMDWGLAKLLVPANPEGGTPEPDGASGIGRVRMLAPGEASVAGTVMGTPAYMAPEQANGVVEALDARTDVFGLGAILCEILTGKPPYAASLSVDVLLLAARGDLADTHSRLDGCGADAELLRLAKACLAPRRDDRPPDAGAVAEAVAAHQAGVEQRWRRAELERVAAEARANAERRARWRTAGMVAAGLVLVGVLLGAGWWWRQLWTEANKAVAETLIEAEKLSWWTWETPVWVLPSQFENAERAAQKAVALSQAGFASTANKTRAEQLLKKAVEQRREAEDGFKLLELLCFPEAPKALPEREDKRDVDRELAALRISSIDGAFKAWGLSLEGTSLEEAKARIQRQPRAIIPEIVAFLDEWSERGRQLNRPKDICRKLVDLANSLDPDPVHQELRKSLYRGVLQQERLAGDVARALMPVSFLTRFVTGEQRNQLRRLARSRDSSRSSIVYVLLVAWGLRAAGDDAEAERLLRSAVQWQPREIVLQVQLASLLLEQRPPRRDEADECFKAAFAIRPSSTLAGLMVGEPHGTVPDLGQDFTTFLQKMRDTAKPSGRFESACAALSVVENWGFSGTPPLNDQQKAEVRRQALDWLRMEMADWAKRLDDIPSLGDRYTVHRTMRMWQYTVRLANVRDEEELAKLPEAERNDWQKFWAEAAALQESARAEK